MKKVTFMIGVMGKGGAERVVANLANNLVDKSWDITIVTIFGNRQDYHLDERIHVYPILCKCPVRILRPFERFLQIRKRIMMTSPDLVVSFLADVNIHTIVALAGTKQKIIVSERNDPTKDPEQSWMRKLRDLLYKKANGIVFQTIDAMNYFDFIDGNRVKKVIIPNPISENLPFYNAETANKSFITACRLNQQKNLPLMIDAMGKLIQSGYECQLDIYGDGVLKDEIQKYITQKGLDSIVHLRGFSKDIHTKMKEAFAFVISSDYEGISNSMLEALAIGIPVIATDCPVGGARMYIGDNNEKGYLVECNNVDQLTAAMEEVLCYRSAAIQKGVKASELRNELSPNIISNMWQNYISQFLRKER